jgi:predicted transcriptional regulator
MEDVKFTAVTVRLDPELEEEFDRAAASSGRSRSDVVRDGLRRQLALDRLSALRRRIMPFAGAAGYLTDEDVFRDVS